MQPSSLTVAHVAQNYNDEIVTTLLLDASVVIRMEKALKDKAYSVITGDHELYGLLELLRECDGAIALSPGFAFSEMPPAAAARSVALYNAFIEQYLPMYVDSPDSIMRDFSGEVLRTKGSYEYVYTDLNRNERFTVGLPYASLLLLNCIEHGICAEPLEKYVKYLKVVERGIDIISAKESEIARFCFSPIPLDHANLNDVRRKIRNNFLKTKRGKPPRTSKEVSAVAYNGARDLTLLNAANIVDDCGVDGARQDCWVATHDFKLADFCSVFHHIKVDGQPGKGIVLSSLPRRDDSEYWELSKNEFLKQNFSRRAKVKSMDVKTSALLRSVTFAEQQVATMYTISLPF